MTTVTAALVPTCARCISTVIHRLSRIVVAWLALIGAAACERGAEPARRSDHPENALAFLGRSGAETRFRFFNLSEEVHTLRVSRRIFTTVTIDTGAECAAGRDTVPDEKPAALSDGRFDLLQVFPAQSVVLSIESEFLSAHAGQTCRVFLYSFSGSSVESATFQP